MAGHSKWANIQHRKKAQDNKRGKLFTRLIKEVSVAARQGGGDPASNARLRLALDKANAGNVPKDTIDRAVKKATGELDGVTYEEARYEGYGPAGVAIMVECVTDNKNRTVSEVRHAFTKYGGNLGTDGSVAYLFEKVGFISVGVGNNEDKVMESALEAGAEDILDNGDGSFIVLTNPDNLTVVKEALESNDVSIESAEVTMKAATEVDLDETSAEKVMKLLDVLEDLDDTQQVHSNASFPDSILNA